MLGFFNGMERVPLLMIHTRDLLTAYQLRNNYWITIVTIMKPTMHNECILLLLLLFTFFCFWLLSSWGGSLLSHYMVPIARTFCFVSHLLGNHLIYCWVPRASLLAREYEWRRAVVEEEEEEEEARCPRWMASEHADRRHADSLRLSEDQEEEEEQEQVEQ